VIGLMVKIMKASRMTTRQSSCKETGRERFFFLTGRKGLKMLHESRQALVLLGSTFLSKMVNQKLFCFWFVCFSYAPFVST